MHLFLVEIFVSIPSKDSQALQPCPQRRLRPWRASRARSSGSCNMSGKLRGLSRMQIKTPDPKPLLKILGVLLEDVCRLHALLMHSWPHLRLPRIRSLYDQCKRLPDPPSSTGCFWTLLDDWLKSIGKWFHKKRIPKPHERPPRDRILLDPVDPVWSAFVCAEAQRLSANSARLWLASECQARSTSRAAVGEVDSGVLQ